jgi:hypothetical protein
MGELKWWEEQPRLWKELVPRSGQAATIQGELIRCTGKLADEAYRNGNINWDSGYEHMARFVGNTLNDPQTFTPGELLRLKAAVTEIIENFERPDVSGHGSPHYLLTEMAVRWCLAHPESIPSVKDPDLRR